VALQPEEKVQVLRKAFALYFECEEEEVGNFIFATERNVDGDAMFSAGWSQIPHWYLMGLVKELEAMIEKLRVSGLVPPDQLTASPADLQRLLGGE
jgi:hypothetical protein